MEWWLQIKGAKPGKTLKTMVRAGTFRWNAITGPTQRLPENTDWTSTKGQANGVQVLSEENSPAIKSAALKYHRRLR